MARLVRLVRRYFILGSGLHLVACGGGDSTEPPPPVTVTITPASATVNAGETQSFTATVTHATNPAVTWSATGGTITGAGATITFAAPLEGGPYQVTARSVADPARSATATVTVRAIAVTVSPAAVTIGAGGTQEFTATVSNSTSASVTWSATGGTIAGTGTTITYTAPATGGSYTVRAASTVDPSKSGSASATVTPVAVVVAPASRAAFRGEPVSVSATVTGAAVTGVNWTASCGTIAGAGTTVTWTAPQSPGNCTVTARSVLDPAVASVSMMTVRPAFLVTSLGDANDGVCSWTHCSLREALTAANADPGTDTISLVVPAPVGAAVANTIVLTTSLPAITTPVHIVGPGADVLAIDADATAGSPRRIFEFDGAFAGSLAGLTLTGGVAAGGGAVVVNGGADVSLTGITMTDNEARSGDGGGLRVLGASVARLTNVIIEGNRTVGADVPGAGMSVSNGSTVTMTGGRIKDNVVQNGWGGGVRVLNASLTLTNVLVQGNRVEAGAAGGGGIFAEQQGTISLSNVTVTGNSAPAGEGGGVRIVDGPAGAILNSTISNNTASGGGGLVLGSTGAFVVTGSTVTGNTASTRAGGVWLWGNADVTFSNTTVSNNVAQTAGGGGVYLQNTARARLESSTVSGNQALGTAQIGGGIAAFQGTTLVVVNSGIESNTLSSGFGGGVYATGATVTLTGATVRSNTGTTIGGAGLAVIENSVLTMAGGTVRDNVAPGGAGGGLFIRGSTASITDASFIDNDATLAGGAIQAVGATQATLANVTVTGNHSETAGGGVSVVEQSSLTLSGSQFSANTTGGSGAAVWKAGTTTLVVTDSRFTGNSAALQGGALQLGGTGSATLQRVTLSGNAAVTGGGAVTNGSILLIENSTISGNTSGTMAAPASGQGGGLFFASTGNSTIRNSTVSGNTATTHGGGISVTGVAAIQGVTIANNTGSTFGAGLAANNNGNVTITNSLLAANTITGEGTINCGAGGASIITSLGYNLSDNLSCSVADVLPGVAAPFFVHPNDKVNAAANLGPLADNGGPTRTHALQAGSAAINGGNPATCTTTDQRGYSRAGACDIGAFEAGGLPPAGRTADPAIGSRAPAAAPLTTKLRREGLRATIRRGAGPPVPPPGAAVIMR